jgi:glycosyltransferase involved in cell wall biosynthesis
MRILYVLTSLGIGGAEKLALALGEQMARRGHTVALLVLMPPVPEQWPTHLEAIHLGITRSFFSRFSGILRARRFAAAFRPDIIHSHSFHANLIARVLWPFVPGAAVATVHNVYEGGTLRMFCYRITDGLSRRTVAVSEAAARRFIHLKAIPAKKCAVIANGIDTVKFAPDAARRARMRADLGILENQFLWLAAGRIAPAKDYPNLLRAFTLVHAPDPDAHRPDARLWIAGEGIDADLAMLGALARDLGIEKNIRWLGLRRDMPALLEAADAFVSASAWEGMPLAVGEAMAMEKPVIATDVGGVRELVGGAGQLVPARDPQALSEAMCDLMQRSRKERRMRGGAARERIVRNFGMEAWFEKWEQLYQELHARP